MNYGKQIARTYAPMLAGYIVSFFSMMGIHVTSEARAWLAGAITAVAGAAYYLVVTLLEKKWPKLGALIGVPERPQYIKDVDWLDSAEFPVDDPADDEDLDDEAA